ncbi:hypothetical protein DFH06DRAFT_1321839 [Mycena polygramma]|nr:hypothetical protein DFH06DRAFT_1321839 [Mycena polygramma]
MAQCQTVSKGKVWVADVVVLPYDDQHKFLLPRNTPPNLAAAVTVFEEYDLMWTQLEPSIKSALQLRMDELAKRLSIISFGIIGVVCFTDKTDMRTLTEAYAVDEIVRLDPPPAMLSAAIQKTFRFRQAVHGCERSAQLGSPRSAADWPVW